MADEDEVIMPGRGVLAEVDVAGLGRNGDARTFEYTDRLGQQNEGFLMRWADGFVAYENRCPHWSIPLGFDDENFLSETGRDIVCPMHGARFVPDTGECWEGPCLGDRLEKFDVELRGTTAVIRRKRLSVSLIG